MALAPAMDPVTRDGARDEARRELSKGVYQSTRRPLWERVLNHILDWLNNRSQDVHSSTGVPAVFQWFILALLIVGVIVLVLYVTGGLRRSAQSEELFAGESGPTTAEQHRRRADEHAAAGRYAEAIRERMRAVARELEDRGVLDNRPGRTADEIAAEAGGLVPGIRADLRRAAWIFDEVWFGERTATAAWDGEMAAVDTRIRQAHLVVSADSAAAEAGWSIS
ncbi:MAG: DUF4129 domain-containing protein [Mycobacteriales bacterium]